MIEFRRGNSFFFRFQRKYTDDRPIMTKSEKMWFSVKENINSKKVLIQKTFDDGITFTEDGYYHVAIKPNDTKTMRFKKKYIYDIQIENAGLVKTIKYDIFRVKEKVTDEGGNQNA